MNTNILITGGAGFIGSSFVAQRLNDKDNVTILDKLTYSGNIENLNWIKEFDLTTNFIKGDISDQHLVAEILKNKEIDYIVNFAAETHVDNSISDPTAFMNTNIIGTYNLLITANKYYQNLDIAKKHKFRFLHISTDEVYGELADTGQFSEQSKYAPNSPYSASKASSDHLIRAWHKTYGLPTIITNCSNNYGVRQHPEKLIPTIIINALNEQPIPIYGNGNNIRDWIHVDDHNHGVYLALTKGKIGETYCLGVNNEKTNNEIVLLICNLLDKIKPRKNNQKYQELITYVKDRAGHDQRYSIDNSKAKQELGFLPKHSFEDKLKETITWYINNPEWIQHILS